MVWPDGRHQVMWRGECDASLMTPYAEALGPAFDNTDGFDD
jgi:hypothetical protein